MRKGRSARIKHVISNQQNRYPLSQLPHNLPLLLLPSLPAVLGFVMTSNESLCHPPKVSTARGMNTIPSASQSTQDWQAQTIPDSKDELGHPKVKTWGLRGRRSHLTSPLTQSLAWPCPSQKLQNLTVWGWLPSQSAPTVFFVPWYCRHPLLWGV